MVQQTDTKFSEYVLANTETGLSKNDNKTSLRDLQYENRNMVPKSDGSDLLKENKVSGVKRPHPESTMITTSQQQMTTTASSASGPLVYVRRKTESDQHKNNTCNKANDELKKSHGHNEKNIEQCPVKDSTVCIDKAIPEPKTSEGVSSTTPLATLDTGKSNITSPVADSSRLQLDNAKGPNLQHWEERFLRLQNILKSLDLSKQDEYCQMLQTLSSVGLSKVAVELEKRSIQLSLEEAREIQRAKLVDVLNNLPRTAVEHKSMK